MDDKNKSVAEPDVWPGKPSHIVTIVFGIALACSLSFLNDTHDRLVETKEVLRRVEEHQQSTYIAYRECQAAVEQSGYQLTGPRLEKKGTQ